MLVHKHINYKKNVKSNGHDKDVIYAMCHNISEKELEEYCNLSILVVRNRNITQLNEYIDDSLIPYWKVIPNVVKKAMFFSILSVDDWLKNWVCDPNHQHRKRPPLKQEIVINFFEELQIICKEYSLMRYVKNETDFVNLITTMYDRLNGVTFNTVNTVEINDDYVESEEDICITQNTKSKRTKITTSIDLEDNEYLDESINKPRKNNDVNTRKNNTTSSIKKVKPNNTNLIKSLRESNTYHHSRVVNVDTRYDGVL